MKKYCCQDMFAHIEEEKDSNEYKSKHGIIYSPCLNEYGIPVDDVSYIVISYCPWCGQKLPPSLREEWCNKLIDGI